MTIIDTRPNSQLDDVPSTKVDGVQLAIVSARLESIAYKMSNTLYRTARGPVINTAHDLSCCVVNANSELVASADSLPVHLMRGPDLLNDYLKEVHPVLRKGDAFLNNSPYNGGTHPADWTILVPVIDEEGRHRFTTVAKGHATDTGMSQPTTVMVGARTLYEEAALLFPCVKVQEDYQDIGDVMRMWELRCRVPAEVRGDYRALVAAARIGEREMTALAQEFGWDQLEAYIGQWFDYCDRKLADVIRRLPAGKATGTSTLDSMDVFQELTVKATVEIDPDAATVTVDLRDNEDCMPNGFNLTEATALTSGYVGVFMSIPDVIPANAGSFRRIKVLIRENCAVGKPVVPHSCSAATGWLFDRAANAVMLAMSEIAEGVGHAEIGGILPAASPSISGLDGRYDDKPYINILLMGVSGGGGTPCSDAWLTALSCGTNGLIKQDSIEILEQQYPLVYWKIELQPDTGGAGRFRGAPSLRAEWGPLHPMFTIWFADGCDNGPKGARGGGPGGKAKQFVRGVDGVEVPASAFTQVELQPGEIVVSYSNGGGGYGFASQRDPLAVAHDVAEGWVTRDRAAVDYGVVIDAGGDVDIDATNRRRSEMG